MALSHKPQVLYRASIERRLSARRAFDANDYPVAVYLSGLAVECVLQAVALRQGAAHDARHSLSSWLAKCPVALQDGIKGEAGDSWNKVVALWDNGIRYLSQDGVLGYLRDKGRAVGISGGPMSIIRTNAKRLLESAQVVHNKAVAQWIGSTKK